MSAIALPSHSPPGSVARSYVLRRALKLASYCAVAGLIGVFLMVAVATLPVFFGYHTYTVDGRSMEPALKRGSVAIAAPTSPRALGVGDIIAYRHLPENPPVLHRIVQVTNEDGQLRFVTQGDQNQTPDAQLVSLQGPGDKVLYTVPYAGYVLDFVSSTLGRVLLLGLPLPALLIMFFTPWTRPEESRAQPATAPQASQRAPARQSAQPRALEAQAFQRGFLTPQAQGAGPTANAYSAGPPQLSLVPRKRVRTSLEAQAFELGLSPPAGADPTSQSRAA